MHRFARTEDAYGMVPVLALEVEREGHASFTCTSRWLGGRVADSVSEHCEGACLVMRACAHGAAGDVFVVVDCEQVPRAADLLAREVARARA